MKKAEFIKKFSKIEDTLEDEFRAEFNSPELLWEALKEQLTLTDVVGQSEQLTCPSCKSTNILSPDKDNDAQCIECAFIWAG